VSYRTARMPVDHYLECRVPEHPRTLGNLFASDDFTSSTVTSSIDFPGISTVKGSPRAAAGGLPAAEMVTLTILTKDCEDQVGRSFGGAQVTWVPNSHHVPSPHVTYTTDQMQSSLRLTFTYRNLGSVRRCNFTAQTISYCASSS
jgi:hypothetical protein